MAAIAAVGALIAATVPASSLGAVPSETIALGSVKSHVAGRATLRAQGKGTHVVLKLHGLAPGARVLALLQAGTCSRPSASFASILAAKADPRGIVHAAGGVRAHGRPVGVGTTQDGSHIITIVGERGVVACGAIPGLN